MDGLVFDGQDVIATSGIETGLSVVGAVRFTPRCGQTEPRLRIGQGRKLRISIGQVVNDVENQMLVGSIKQVLGFR